MSGDVGPPGMAFVLFPFESIKVKDSIHGAWLTISHGSYGVSFRSAAVLDGIAITAETIRRIEEIAAENLLRML